MAAPGNKPSKLKTFDLMVGREYCPSLRECLSMGTFMATQQRVEAMCDMRNFEKRKEHGIE